MKAYEVFSPTDGIARVTVKYRWIARLIARLMHLDYEEAGNGWIA